MFSPALKTFPLKRMPFNKCKVDFFEKNNVLGPLSRETGSIHCIWYDQKTFAGVMLYALPGIWTIWTSKTRLFDVTRPLELNEMLKPRLDTRVLQMLQLDTVDCFTTRFDWGRVWMRKAALWVCWGDLSRLTFTSSNETGPNLDVGVAKRRVIFKSPVKFSLPKFCRGRSAPDFV